MLSRCGHCNTLSVARKIIRYKTYVKDVGEIVIDQFPMLVCQNPCCREQWISGEGDKAIEDEVVRIQSAG